MENTLGSACPCLLSTATWWRGCACLSLRSVEPFAHFLSFFLCLTALWCAQSSPPSSRLFLSWEISLTTAPSQTISAHYPQSSTAPSDIFTCCTMMHRSRPCAIRHVLIFIYLIILSLRTIWQKNSLYLMRQGSKRTEWQTFRMYFQKEGRRWRTGEGPRSGRWGTPKQRGDGSVGLWSEKSDSNHCLGVSDCHLLNHRVCRCYLGPPAGLLLTSPVGSFRKGALICCALNQLPPRLDINMVPVHPLSVCGNY